MNTGSYDERKMLSDFGRIAKALERIANVLEEKQYGVTTAEVEATKQMLREDMLRGRNAQDDLAKEESSE